MNKDDIYRSFRNYVLENYGQSRIYSIGINRRRGRLILMNRKNKQVTHNFVAVGENWLPVA